MLKYWEEATENENHPHVPLMLSSTFKAVTGIKYFCQPLALETDAGRKIGVWFSRFLGIWKEEGSSSGPLFVGHKDKRMSGAEMDLLFHTLLLEVKRRFARVLPESVDGKNEFSTYRSFRRGSTSEAQNTGMPQQVIEANNRWRKRSRAKGMKPSMSMMEHYSDAKVCVPSLIKFSALLPG